MQRVHGVHTPAMPNATDTATKTHTLADGTTLTIGSRAVYKIGGDSYVYEVVGVRTGRQVVVQRPDCDNTPRVVKLRSSKRGDVWSHTKLNRGRPVGSWTWNSSRTRNEFDRSF